MSQPGSATCPGSCKGAGTELGPASAGREVLRSLLTAGLALSTSGPICRFSLRGPLLLTSSSSWAPEINSWSEMGWLAPPPSAPRSRGGPQNSS